MRRLCAGSHCQAAWEVASGSPDSPALRSIPARDRFSWRNAVSRNAVSRNVTDHVLHLPARGHSTKHAGRSVPASHPHYADGATLIIRRWSFRFIQWSGLCRSLGIHTGIVLSAMDCAGFILQRQLPAEYNVRYLDNFAWFRTLKPPAFSDAAIGIPRNLTWIYVVPCASQTSATNENVCGEIKRTKVVFHPSVICRR